MNGKFIILGIGAGLLSWAALRPAATPDSTTPTDYSGPPDSAPASDSTGIDIMGLLSDAAAWIGLRTVSNLKRVDRLMLKNANVQAMLRVIREGESGQGDNAYRLIVGGKSFVSFADHPRIYGVPNSTAAGAYQITATTWDWIKGPMGLFGFGPSNQDFAALGLIAYRGALKDVLAGNLAAAISALRSEWTSLPGAKENQRLTHERARQLFVAYGGRIAGSVFA